MSYLSPTVGIPLATITGGPLAGTTIHAFDPDINKPSRYHEEPKKEIRLREGHLSRTGNYTYKADPNRPRAPPQLTLEPICTYTAGPNGSGKSTAVANWAKSLLKLIPGLPVFVFSDLEKDPTIDSIPGVQRVILDETLVDDPFTKEDFEDCIIIFDDIDSIMDKKIAKAVKNLLQSILKTNRHTNTWLAVTNHMVTDYRDTRMFLSQCAEITLFPKAGGATNQLVSVMKNSCGLDPATIERALNLPGRWITIHKSCPRFILYDSGIILL